MMRREFLRRGAALGATAGLSRTGLIPARGAAADPAFKAGFAERDITPALGMEKPGGYGKAYHRKFHDPCKVRVAVFDDGSLRVALVGVDALMVPRSLVLEARVEIRRRCGIPGEHVLVGASHSHSSGPTGMVQPGEYDHASQLVRRLAYEKSSCADAGYLERVRAEIVEGVCQADRARSGARCGIGAGVEDRAAYNRRFRMRNGLTYSHPGKGNPDIVEPAGPIDPQVGVIGAWDPEGRLRGCIVHYACHATTDPGGVSANWIHYLEETIRGVFGSGAIVVFLQGACGDVTQVDNRSRHDNPGPERWARFVGGRVGAEAVKVLLGAEPGSLAPLGAASRVLRLERRVPSPERVKRSLEIVRGDPASVDPTTWTFAKEIVLLDALLAKHPTAEVEVQAVQVGPAVFVTNPAEFFCQLGLDIRAGSPFPFTFPVELANGSVGYVPTEEALGSRGGGYETRLTSYSNLKADAGRRMVETGLELARSFSPGRAPEPPSAPPFRAPWSYGNVPPELD
jgi:hypothetical protein